MNRRLTSALGTFLLLGTAASLARAGQSYSGDVIRPDGSSVRMTISIDTLTSDDTTLALAEMLLEKGLAPVTAELAGMRAGQLTFGEDVSVPANVIRVLDTEQGKVVAVVTDQPLIASAAEARASRGVGFIELRLGAEGPGSGRLIPSAEIVFGADGYLEAKSLDGRELKVQNVSGDRP